MKVQTKPAPWLMNTVDTTREVRYLEEIIKVAGPGEVSKVVKNLVRIAQGSGEVKDSDSIRAAQLLLEKLLPASELIQRLERAAARYHRQVKTRDADFSRS